MTHPAPPRLSARATAALHRIMQRHPEATAWELIEATLILWDQEERGLAPDPTRRDGWRGER